MYRVVKSIDIDFAHHVHGHAGPCINLHGHTWKFEVCMEAPMLNATGFVCDFSDLKSQVLNPVHAMLDHGFAIFGDTLRSRELFAGLQAVGTGLVSTRPSDIGPVKTRSLFQYPASTVWDVLPPKDTLNGAYDVVIGGIKVIVFPTAPTSERIARWLYDLTVSNMVKPGAGIRCAWARVYETLHPVQAYAEYSE